MSNLLSVLQETADPRPERLAKILGCAPEDVERELEELRKNKTLLGWMPLLNPIHNDLEQVRAVIEVKISPEREGGFDRMAMRISKFEDVESCYLMSGGYDLLVFVTGKNLRSVASFISERLATIHGVLSTATHFLLRPYKDHGHILVEESQNQEKPSVSP
ncbi:MAG: Lrp/AsnC family transcriptional regulator [Opitutales bacterium]|nr:Lrp/AsnC family transcriptional regulator [Opitutales bacterium]MDG1324308.1 Lrp/AsnC family transcriptional regulator [Opitutales bacterium]